MEVKIAADDGWESFVFAFDELISPAKNANSRSFFVPFVLNTKRTADFLKTGIGLSIAIRAEFESASGKRVVQRFGDMYICEPSVLKVNHPIGKGHQHQYTEEYDGPSTIVRLKGFRVLENDEQLPSKPN